MPWVSMPRRSARTRQSAMVVARSEGTPLCVRMLVVKAWAWVGEMRVVGEGSVAMGFGWVEFYGEWILLIFVLETRVGYRKPVQYQMRIGKSTLGSGSKSLASYL